MSATIIAPICTMMCLLVLIMLAIDEAWHNVYDEDYEATNRTNEEDL